MRALCWLALLATLVACSGSGEGHPDLGGGNPDSGEGLPDGSGGNPDSRLPPGPPPTISAISPAQGPSTGGTPLTITGTNFTAGSTVTVSGVACRNTSVNSATSITCTTAGKPGAFGPQAVVVTDSGQQMASSMAFKYFYGTLDFAPVVKQNAPATASLGEIQAHDLNQDGILDLVAADLTDGAVQILFGKADGTFASPTQFPVGNAPVGLAIADFNEDGCPDLATANSGGNKVAVFWQNKNGTTCQGTFAAAPGSAYSVGVLPQGLVAIDLNQDKHIDLAVANSGSATVSVLLNKPATPGQFMAGTTVTLSGNPNNIGAADLDQDGANDLVVTNDGNTTVSVLYQVKATPGTFAAIASPLAAVGKTAALVLADYNQDGYPDVLVTPSNGTMYTYFQNNQGTASRTFLAGRSAALGILSGLVPFASAADFDGDGFPDLAVASVSDGKMFVLKNTGAATLAFGAAQSFPSDVGTWGLAAGKFGKAGSFARYGQICIATTNTSDHNEDIGVFLADNM